MTWMVEDKGFSRERIELNGSKFLIGNGYMGYRGTLEEYGKEQLVSCVLSGVYDQSGDQWREPVNAPNGLKTRIFCNGELLSPLSMPSNSHSQRLSIRYGMHQRETAFAMAGQGVVRIKSERFLSLDDVHLLCMGYQIVPSVDCEIVIETGIDGDVWDIFGPHFQHVKAGVNEDVLFVEAETNTHGCRVVTAESLKIRKGEQTVIADGRSVMRRIVIHAKANEEYSFTKYISVYTTLDLEDPYKAALEASRSARAIGYDALCGAHRLIWDERWGKSDVTISGDDEAQMALRYSIYHLLIIAPNHSDKLSIPARGLSGQVYKGAVFWDTEMFMLPFFIYTNPQLARNLMKYRCHTLDGARRKAKEYGYRGAFYAWESQDSGDDACTHFNVTDVFTGRPMRTYFRDKQVHISADVAYGIWQYYTLTGDESILLEGGAEVILECARFLFSYAYFKMDKGRYEILDVTGPDEYHERVNNSAYTNRMAKHVFETALETLELLRNKHADFYENLVNRIDFKLDLLNIQDICESLYIPEPRAEDLVIEQFDGYHRMEEVSLKTLKSRILDTNEYLGGGNGLATTTKILKQADVVLMLNIFKDRYPLEVKKANWEYYEPRTEHGSSLSPCVYALLAADIGNPEWGYKYFMKTATIDLTGDAKQYVGTLYIGGTHPAANGGAWMSAILGFAGVRAHGQGISIQPRLPSKWESIRFHVTWLDQDFDIFVDRRRVKVIADSLNTKVCSFSIGGSTEECIAGKEIEMQYA